MSRFAAAAAVVSMLASSAPIQCSHKPDPDVHVEDAGDALWSLAMDFRAKGNEEAARHTLRVLVEKYPSNRHVPAAKQELAGGAGDGGAWDGGA